MITFDTVFNRLMGSEGGYVNDPSDPGGETKWGISKRNYPRIDIKNLTRESAKEIYRNDFWIPLSAHNLPSSIVYQLFDFAVNSGISTAIRYFQQVLGIADDGHWGPISTAAASKFDENDILFKLLAARLKFMTKCSNWPSAGKGWANRIGDMLIYASMDNASLTEN